MDMMRSGLVCLLLLVGGCRAQPDRPRLASKAQLAQVEAAVSSCTAATGRLTPLIARGQRADLAHAAVDARNRCSSGRATIAGVLRALPSLAVCRADVDAQERVSIAELAVLDATTPERRAAVVQALDDAIALQDRCGTAIASLRTGG